MNPRYTPEVRALVAEVLQIALDTPQEVADIFVSFVPHVDLVNVRVYYRGAMKSGEFGDPDFVLDEYLRGQLYEADSLAQMPSRIREFIGE